MVRHHVITTAISLALTLPAQAQPSHPRERDLGLRLKAIFAKHGQPLP